jgi:hypothetical protein
MAGCVEGAARQQPVRELFSDADDVFADPLVEPPD